MASVAASIARNSGHPRRRRPTGRRRPRPRVGDRRGRVGGRSSRPLPTTSASTPARFASPGNGSDPALTSSTTLGVDVGAEHAWPRSRTARRAGVRSCRGRRRRRSQPGTLPVAPGSGRSRPAHDRLGDSSASSIARTPRSRRPGAARPCGRTRRSAAAPKRSGSPRDLEERDLDDARLPVAGALVGEVLVARHSVDRHVLAHEIGDDDALRLGDLDRADLLLSEPAGVERRSQSGRELDGHRRQILGRTPDRREPPAIRDTLRASTRERQTMSMSWIIRSKITPSATRARVGADPRRLDVDRTVE